MHSPLPAVARGFALAGLIAIALINEYELKLRVGSFLPYPIDDGALDIKRLERLRPLLPRAGRVGYVSDFPGLNTGTNPNAVTKFSRVRYALVPFVVHIGTEEEFIVVDFADASSAASQIKGFAVIKDFGDGLMLLRKRKN
jgi:hypothetical protein